MPLEAFWGHVRKLNLTPNLIKVFKVYLFLVLYPCFNSIFDVSHNPWLGQVMPRMPASGGQLSGIGNGKD